MWIFTEIGFFSAVVVDDEPSVVMVRARAKKDLERLIEAIDHMGAEPPEILEWENRDYPYRILLMKSEWADVLALLANRIDYPNFKNRVKEVDGVARAGLYSSIWATMLNVARSIGEQGTNKSVYGSNSYLFNGEDIADEDTTPYAALDEVLSEPPPIPSDARKRSKKKNWLRRKG